LNPFGADLFSWDCSFGRLSPRGSFCQALQKRKTMRNPFFTLLKNTAIALGGHGLGRIKWIRASYNFFFDLLRPRSVTVQGHRMWLDDKDTLELAVHEVYEPMGTDLFKKEIQPGQIVLDIGANIGYYTLLAARLVGPTCRVYAFEPDPSNFKLLRKNVESNGYSNVVLINKAVSNQMGAARLYLSATNKGDHRLYDTGGEKRSTEVEIVALDEFFKSLDKKIHFIKMDIQGAEAAALEGAKNLILANPDLKIFTEFEPSNLRGFGSDPPQYLRSLREMGFRLSEVSEKEKTVKPALPEDLLRRYTVENGEYTNLFCVKSD